MTGLLAGIAGVPLASAPVYMAAKSKPTAPVANARVRAKTEARRTDGGRSWRSQEPTLLVSLALRSSGQKRIRHAATVSCCA